MSCLPDYPFLGADKGVYDFILEESRYFDDKEFMSAVVVVRPSFGWRSMIHGKELLQKNIRKKIGNGNSI